MSEKHKDPGSPDVDTGHATGPTSIQGLEASEFPDERGSVDTDPRRIAARKLPSETGENATGDVGERAARDVADADQHGGRKRN
jgi:hypothetical protein